MMPMQGKPRGIKPKRKRKTLRMLSLEELHAKYARALMRLFKAARTADKLRERIERRERPVKDTARKLGDTE